MTGARFTFVTVQVKLVLADSVPSETLTVTLRAPALAYDSVPVIAPVVGLIVSAGGSPVALNVSVSPSGSLAMTARLTVPFSAFVWSAIAVITGVRFRFVTVHVKLVLADNVPSETLTVTLCEPALAYDNVPVIAPVAGLIVSEGGRLVALNVSVSPSGSLAVTARLIGAFSAFVWSATAVITGARFTLVTVQVKLVLADSVPSDTVTVTLCVPALAYDNVPVMRPVAELIVRLVGRPVAL